AWAYGNPIEYHGDYGVFDNNWLKSLLLSSDNIPHATAIVAATHNSELADEKTVDFDIQLADFLIAKNKLITLKI
ncbi:3019_t:CDS:2, partial [Dentiscutata erythropus]